MFLLIDIGGTNTRLAYAKDYRGFAEPKIIPTPKKFSEAITAVQSAAAELVSGSLNTVVVGLPGPLDAAKTKTFGRHKLPDWYGKPLKQELAKALGAPVLIENDSALVGLGEAVAGAGKGFGIVAYLTISTGVGGARLVDRRIDRNALGFEPGWQIIDADGSLYPENNGPHRLEHLIGGADVERRYGQSPKDIDDPKLWPACAAWLAIALNNTLVYWSPDIVILGGPMMRDIPLGEVRAETARHASFLPNIPPIELASLGDLGGLWGGLAFLQSHNTEDK